jgi:alpha-galactosidase
VLGTPELFDRDRRVLPAAITLTTTTLAGGSRFELTVEADQPCRADRVAAPLDLRVNTMLEHGLQSWSTVRRASPSDVRPERADAPRWFRGQMLADRDGAGVELSGDTYLVHDGGVAGFLEARATLARLRVSTEGHVSAEWLLDDVVLEPGRPLRLDALWVADGDPGVLYSRYATLAARAMQAREFRPIPPAWCSWYQYFDQVSPDDVRENLALARDHGVRVVQIDDGWQREIGVWTDVSDRFGEPLDALASDIRAAGIVAGLWTAPFLAIEGGELARTRPDWLVRNEQGRATTALFHGGWGGRVHALDTSREDVLAHLRDTYRHLRAQGFDYFKIDFCHAAATPGRRADDRVTRAVALRRGLAAVREGIGEDAYLVGCGCPLLSAVGIVDALRVSEDVAPFYEPRLFFPGFDESTVAARNAIEASLLRAPLHERWFALDPDCVLLRTGDTELTAPERHLVALAATASSGSVVLSDRLRLYGDDEWRVAEALFADAPRGPRELVDPFAEVLEVRAGGRSWIFDWGQRFGAERTLG